MDKSKQQNTNNTDNMVPHDANAILCVWRSKRCPPKLEIGSKFRRLTDCISRGSSSSVGEMDTRKLENLVPTADKINHETREHIIVYVLSDEIRGGATDARAPKF